MNRAIQQEVFEIKFRHYLCDGENEIMLEEPLTGQYRTPTRGGVPTAVVLERLLDQLKRVLIERSVSP